MVTYTEEQKVALAILQLAEVTGAKLDATKSNSENILICVEELKEFHRALDLKAAEFITENSDLPNMTVFELLEWNAKRRNSDYQ